MPSLDLEKQLVFYSSYHHNKVNKAVHIVCVPLILMTAILFLTNTPTLVDLPYMPINAASITAFIYCFLYILMEPVAGGLVTPLIFTGTYYVNKLTETYGWEANQWAIYLHIACWIAQFVGHGKFEGRSPALLDNIFQALFLAPFFVWFEILFFLGYRTELQSRIEAATIKNIEKFKASKKAKQQQNIPMDDLTNGWKKMNGNSH